MNIFSNQRFKFSLPDDVHFINAAYMSPLLKTVEEAGINGLLRKRFPGSIQPDDFFDDAIVLKEKFAKLINGNALQVAIVPSASYGLASVFQNIKPGFGNKLLMVEDEFPSVYYTMERWCNLNGQSLQIVRRPASFRGRAQCWNEALLNAIDVQTTALCLSPIHWMDGLVFDLAAVSNRCRETGTKLVIDGTQWIGAHPFDVTNIQPAAVVCAGYKWLMGPYSSGLAWYGEDLLNGQPLEHSWLSRSQARDFTALTRPDPDWMPGAGRFDMGEYGNFIQLPMMIAAMNQLLEWTPTGIQNYCSSISMPLRKWLMERELTDDYPTEKSAAHIFSLQMSSMDKAKELAATLKLKKIYVSVRGTVIRIAPHVYNTNEDFHVLEEVLAANL
jgi:selenocysteine lyase/cysteine desulfurase